jgi:hypothetical protein
LISGRIPIEGIPNLWKQSHCIGYLEGSVDSLTLETSKESESETNRLRSRWRDHLQRTAGSLLLPQSERSHPPVHTACLRRQGSSGNPSMSSKRSVDADVTPTTICIHSCAFDYQGHGFRSFGFAHHSPHRYIQENRMN